MNILSFKKMGSLLILMGFGLIAKAEWVINDNEVSDGNWSFNYTISEDGKITLSKCISGAGTLDISTICQDTNASSLEIGNQLFFNFKGITNVIFPSEPIILNYRAFRGSGLVGEVSTEAPIEFLRGDTFAQTGITSAYFPNIEGEVDTWSFHDCTNLVSVVLSKNITGIGGKCFGECKSLEKIQPIEFPEVTHIDGSAFKNCKKLTAPLLSFPKAKSVGSEAFHSLSGFGEFYMPMCSSIGKSAFYGSGATNIVLAPVVTNIGQYAFGDSKFINFGNSDFALSTLNPGMFNQAKSLKGVLDFSKSTFTSIPGEVFCQMSALEKLILPETLSSLTRNSISKLGKCEIVFLGAKPTYDTTEIFCPSSNNFKNRLSFVITEKHINSWTNAVNDIVFTPLKDVPDSEKTDTYYFPKSDKSRVIGLISTTSLKYDSPITSWLSVLNEVGTIIVIR